MLRSLGYDVGHEYHYWVVYDTSSLYWIGRAGHLPMDLSPRWQAIDSNPYGDHHPGEVIIHRPMFDHR